MSNEETIAAWERAVQAEMTGDRKPHEAVREAAKKNPRLREQYEAAYSELVRAGKAVTHG